MGKDALAEIAFVIPLNFGHVEKAVDKFDPTGCASKTRGNLVFNDVAAFQKTGAVHGGEPPAQGAKRPERPSNHREEHLLEPARFRPEFSQHVAHQLPVMPLLGFDLADTPAFGRIYNAARVSGVCESRRQLARIGGTENVNQGIARMLQEMAHSDQF